MLGKNSGGRVVTVAHDQVPLCWSLSLISIILYLTTCMPNSDWCKIQLMLDILEHCCCTSWGVSILL